MHPSVIEFVESVLSPEDVAGKSVLEVGAYDVNGSVRPTIEALQPSRYLGVDFSAGPGVDLVADCTALSDAIPINCWDVVISTEMLEHVRDWRKCVQQLAGAVSAGGLLLVTTRSPGFPYHPFPEDNWRFTVECMTEIIAALNLELLTIADDPQCPGVFVVARKQPDWLPSDSLDGISAEGVVA